MKPSDCKVGDSITDGKESLVVVAVFPEKVVAQKRVDLFEADLAEWKKEDLYLAQLKKLNK